MPLFSPDFEVISNVKKVFTPGSRYYHLRVLWWSPEKNIFGFKWNLFGGQTKIWGKNCPLALPGYVPGCKLLRTICSRTCRVISVRKQLETRRRASKSQRLPQMARRPDFERPCKKKTKLLFVYIALSYPICSCLLFRWMNQAILQMRIGLSIQRLLLEE